MWWMLPIGFFSGATVQTAINWYNDKESGPVREIKCECQCTTKKRPNDPSLTQPVIRSVQFFGEDGVESVTTQQKKEYAQSVYDLFSDSCVSGRCAVYEKYSPLGKWHNPESFDFKSEKS